MEYCLKATSICTKTTFKTPKKNLNKLARMITGYFDYNDTKKSYMALGWMSMKELAVWRTLKMARKILIRRDPKRILRRMAVEINGRWDIKKPKNTRTELGRRTFSQRVCRLWLVIPDCLKIIDLDKKREYIGSN